MRQIFYLVQKEFRQIFRDFSMVRILFVVPLIQIFILGNAITTDVKNIKVIFQDQDKTPYSREFISKFVHSKYFIITGFEEDYTRLSSYLDSGKASLAIIIPRHFQRDIVLQKKPDIQLLVDGVDGNSAGVSLGYITDIVQKYQERLMEYSPELSLQVKNVRRIEMEPRFWFNPNLESKLYIVPGIIALILLIITLFLTSMGIVREKEIGTLEQLMVTPIRSYQLVIGKIIPFSILGMLEIMISMGFVYLIFGIGVKGSLLLLLFESSIFIISTLGLGIFISTISDTQQQALFVAWFFMIFSILLSGFFIPIANMPPVIQHITRLNPLRYYIVILREIYLKGTSIKDLIPETLSMVTFSTCLFLAAVIRFRKKLG
ncbi:MAG: ABC transporter permease [Desulfobacterales bacterium]|nr:ABC transporter permease [Desulfobacterales bacterium]